MKNIVTIGFCVRNNEGTIKEAINSVVDQDFPHDLMEIIVVDGASRDKTLSIIKELLLKTDISVKFFSENKGLGFARQLIVDNAIGKYVLWVDGDLILSTDYVQKQVDIMERYPKIGITWGIIGIPPINVILTLELVPSVVDHIRYNQPRSFLWKTKKLPGTAAAMFRTITLKQVKGFDVQLRGSGEDWDIAHRIDAAGWEVIPNDAVYYEQHGEMSTLVALFKKYHWYGRTIQSLYHKNSGIISIIRLSPPAGFLTGFFYSLLAYKLLHRKIMFLLPFHFAFKTTAWSLGFIRSQFTAEK